jgi:hypothetical protein
MVGRASTPISTEISSASVVLIWGRKEEMAGGEVEKNRRGVKYRRR